jgi:hypothetical protein
MHASFIKIEGVTQKRGNYERRKQSDGLHRGGKISIKFTLEEARQRFLQKYITSVNNVFFREWF